MAPTPEHEAAAVVRATAADAAEALQATAADRAAALEQLAKEEAYGLVTAASLAEGQRKISDDIRSSRTREFIMLGAFLVFALVFGSWAIINTTTASSAKDAAHEARIAAEEARTVSLQQAADRKQATVNSCIQYNVQQQQRREGNVNLLVEGFRPFTADAAKLEKFKASLVVIAEATWPYRDCSDAGIATYLQHPPPDPAIGG